MIHREQIYSHRSQDHEQTDDRPSKRLVKTIILPSSLAAIGQSGSESFDLNTDSVVLELKEEDTRDSEGLSDRIEASIDCVVETMVLSSPATGLNS
jgi:hypothetical protein